MLREPCAQVELELNPPAVHAVPEYCVLAFQDGDPSMLVDLLGE